MATASMLECILCIILLLAVIYLLCSLRQQIKGGRIHGVVRGGVTFGDITEFCGVLLHSMVPRVFTSESTAVRLADAANTQGRSAAATMATGARSLGAHAAGVLDSGASASTRAVQLLTVPSTLLDTASDASSDILLGPTSNRASRGVARVIGRSVSPQCSG